MGTDYGVGCETCDRNDQGLAHVIIDNYRDPGKLAELIADPVVLGAIDELAERGFRVLLEDSDYYSGAQEALLLARKHVALGHVVRVVDEYGTWWGKCIKWSRCGACRTTRRCVLDTGHAGECTAEAK